SPGAESHDFELTLADMAAIETCDLFAYVGGEGEGWVYDALDTFGENGIEVPTFCAMEAVEKAGMLVHSAGEHDHDHDTHEHNHWEGIDDHVWLSVPNAMVIYETMLDTLRSLYEDWWDPAEEPDAADSWKYRLTMLDEKFRTLTESAEDPSILVADRFPFAYLTETYGIAHEAAFEGCTSDTEPSLDTVNRLISLTETLSPRTILVTELSDRQTASSIAAQVSGVTIAELHSCHNVTKEDFENGVTYFDLMERNYTVLENLWNK
ncbi:MAG: zinc ABC transporter substrate-binding protein, partial [Clostridia bacterium]|nr:zinc ABC transporter substrate-binding protein [Clostridia bacterium]